MVDTLSVTAVDELLSQARQLLGSMNPVQLDVALPTVPQAPDSWDSAAAGSATQAAAQLGHDTEELRAAHQAVAAAVAEANAIARSAHTQLNAVENAWASDQAALDPAAGTDDNHAGILQSAQHHVREVTAVVQAAAEQFQVAAQRITAATTSLSA